MMSGIEKETPESILPKVDVPLAERATNIIFSESKDVLSTYARQDDIAPTEIADSTLQAQKNIEYEKLFSRWFNLGTIQWSTTDARGKQIVGYPLPAAIKGFGQYAEYLVGIHAFYKFDLVFRLQANVTKFHVGRLGMYFTPMALNVDTSTDGLLTRITAYPHAFVDAASQNIAELRVPYSNVLSYVQNASQDDYVLGSLNTVVLRKLEAATGASTTVQATLWLSMQQAQLLVPSKYRGAFTSERVEMQMFASLGATLGGAVDEITKPIQDVVLPVITAIGMFGDNANQIPSTESERRVLNLASSQGPSHSMRMGLNPAANLENSVEIYRQHDEMNLGYLVSIPVVCLEFDASVLTNVPVMPTFSKPSVKSSGTPVVYSIDSYPQTFIGYVANFFTYWRGTLNYKIEFITSMFTTGRIAISYVDENVLITTDNVVDCNYPTIVCDLQERRTFRFSIPYVCETPFKEVAQKCWSVNTSTGVLTVKVGNGMNGLILIRPLNEIVYPPGVPNVCSAWLWISGGEDFEVAVPKGTNNEITISIPPNPTIEEYEMQMFAPEGVTPRLDVLDQGYPPLFEKKVENAGRMVSKHFGDKVTHLKDVIGRYSLIGQINCNPEVITRIGFGPLITEGTLTTPIGYFHEMFALYRGGFRISIATDATKFVRLVAFVVYRPNPTQPTIVEWESASATSFPIERGHGGHFFQNLSDNPLINFEFPYYSKYEFLSKFKNGGQLWGRQDDIQVYIYSKKIATNTSQTNTGVTAWIYKSAADDFRLFFPIAPPALEEKEVFGEEVLEDENWCSLVLPKRVNRVEMQMGFEMPSFNFSPKTCLLVGASIAFSAGIWGVSMYYGFRSLLSKFEKTSISIIGSLDNILYSFIPFEVKASFKVAFLKVLMSCYDLMRVDNFMDFAIWFARLCCDFPIFKNVFVENLWGVICSLGRPSKVEMQMGLKEDLMFPILIALVSCLFGVTIVGSEKIEKTMARIRNMAMCIIAAGSLSVALPKAKLFFEECVASVFGIVSKDVQELVELKKNLPEITKWIEEVIALDEDETLNRCKYDKAERKRVVDMFVKGKDNYKFICHQKFSPELKAPFNEAFRKMTRMSHAVYTIRDTAVRFEPFCLCLTGPPGIGKTYVAKVLLANMLNCENIKGLENIYSRSGEDEFWSGYNGQKGLVFDDFGKCDPAISKYDCFSEFIAVKSAEPYHLNMAHLEDKGIMCDARAIVMSTNDAFVKPKTLLDFEAFWRRRDMLYEVRSTKGNITLGNYNSLKNFDHLQFRALCPMNRAAPGPWEDYAITKKKICDMYKRWVNKEEARMKLMNDFDALVTMQMYDPEDEMKVLGEPSKTFKVLEPVVPEMSNWGCNAKDATMYTNSFELWWPVEFLEKLKVKQLENNNLEFYFGEAPLPYEQEFFQQLLDELNVTPYEKRRVMRYLETQNWRQRCFKKNGYLEAQKKIDEGIFGWIKSQFSKRSVQLGTALIAGVSLVYLAGKSLWKSDSKQIEERLIEEEIETQSETRKGYKRVRPRIKTVWMQSGMNVDDNETMNLIEHLFPTNFLKIKASSGHFVHALAVCDRFVVMPYHFNLVMQDGMPLEVSNLKRGTVKTLWKTANVKCLDKDSDLLIYLLDYRFPLFRDIRKFFVDENDLAILSHSSCGLAKLIENGIEICRSVCERVDEGSESSVEYGGFGETFVAKGFKYRSATSIGDCGSPVLVFNNYSKGKIIGLHVAGSNMNNGWCNIITKSWIERFLPHKCTTQEEVKVIEEVEAQCNLSGDFTLLGKFEQSMYMPFETKFRKSTIFNEIYESKLEPAILSVRDERNVDRVSPLLKAVENYGIGVPPMDIYDIRESMRSAFFVPGIWCCDDYELVHKSGPLSVDEACKGIFGSHIQALDLDTSPGYPWSLNKVKRSDLLDIERNIVDVRLKSALDELEDDLENGVVPLVIWMDCLKDEKVKFERIKEVKTRSFSIAPIQFLIVLKRYCGKFVDCVLNGYYDHFIKCGINPESPDWNALYNWLRTRGNLALDMDMNKMDRLIDPNFIMAMFECMCEWYSINDKCDCDIETNNRKRMLLGECLIHRNTLAIDLMYVQHWGQSSGNFLTVLINSFVMSCYFRMSFTNALACHDYYPSVWEYDHFFTDAIYGDDSILVGSEKGWDIMSIDHLKEWFVTHNLAIVDPGKNKNVDLGLKELIDVSFLKRKFVKRDGLILPEIEIGSVMEMFNWIRKDLPEVELLEDNFKMAKIFLCSREPTEYNRLLMPLYRKLSQLGCKVMWEDRNSVFVSTYYGI